MGEVMRWRWLASLQPAAVANQILSPSYCVDFLGVSRNKSHVNGLHAAGGRREGGWCAAMNYSLTHVSFTGKNEGRKGRSWRREPEGVFVFGGNSGDNWGN